MASPCEAYLCFESVQKYLYDKVQFFQSVFVF